MNKKSSDVIVTDNYDQFSITKENRGLIPSSVRSLVHSMKRYGWIDAFPMMVIPREDTLEIRDGQNRFAAAKEIRIPVKYVVHQNGQGEIPIAELNKYQKTWTALDYCKSYANQGDPDYQTVVMFMAEEELPLTPSLALLSQISVSLITVRNGNFSVVDVAWAREMASHLRQLRKAMAWSPLKANFVRVFVKACLVKGFSPSKLVKKMTANPDKCIDMATEAGLAKMVEDVYNHRNRRPIPLAYEIGRLNNQCRTKNRKLTPGRVKAMERAASRKQSDKADEARPEDPQREQAQ